MPHERKDCDGGLGNIIEGRGSITDQEYLDFFKRHLTQDEEKFKKYKYSILDYTAATKVEVSKEAIQFIAGLCINASKVNPDPVIAFAADSDLIYGLSRMYEALISLTDWETKVFRSKNEAVEWINERVKEKFGIDFLTFS